MSLRERISLRKRSRIHIEPDRRAWPIAGGLMVLLMGHHAIASAPSLLRFFIGLTTLALFSLSAKEIRGWIRWQTFEDDERAKRLFYLVFLLMSGFAALADAVGVDARFYLAFVFWPVPLLLLGIAYSVCAWRAAKDAANRSPRPWRA
jgi:hypothetical protein